MNLLEELADLTEFALNEMPYVAAGFDLELEKYGKGPQAYPSFVKHIVSGMEAGHLKDKYNQVIQLGEPKQRRSFVASMMANPTFRLWLIKQGVNIKTFKVECAKWLEKS